MNGDYGPFARALHRIALTSPSVGELAFQLECRLTRAAPARDAPHLFITGLARAGTTTMLQLFHRTGEFRSLTYRDMPFVLMPRSWAALSGGSRKSGHAAERAHGDRVKVDFDSPEAFEEVFWRMIDGSSYIRDHALLAHEPTDKVIAKFRRYVGCILDGAKGRRYLCKNNNHLLRLPALRRAFPSSRVLILFRNPVDQAHSLLVQHRRFLEIGSQDPFVRDYMRWLVHHEFGSDHRPFQFGRDPASGGPDTIDYWLTRWIDAYSHIINHAPPDALFVSYDELCSRPSDSCTRLASYCGLSGRLESARLRAPAPPDAPRPTPSLYARANDLRRRLLDRIE